MADEWVRGLLSPSFSIASVTAPGPGSLGSAPGLRHPPAVLCPSVPPLPHVGAQADRVGVGAMASIGRECNNPRTTPAGRVVHVYSPKQNKLSTSFTSRRPSRPIPRRSIRAFHRISRRSLPKNASGQSGHNVIPPQLCMGLFPRNHCWRLQQLYKCHKVRLTD
jgi:hypothetical protein